MDPRAKYICDRRHICAVEVTENPPNLPYSDLETVHSLIAHYRRHSYSFVVDSWSGEVERVLVLNVPVKKAMKGGERTTINITSLMTCNLI